MLMGENPVQAVSLLKKYISIDPLTWFPYSNLAIINHSVSEFVVDFISMMPGAPKAKVKSRIVLTPQHAKKFLKALNDNVSRFEKAHGTIKDYEQPPIPLNFGPTGEA